MDYILGAGLLFAAVLTIALGRLALNRPGARHDPEAFGAAEAIAFFFSVLFAFGVALMARKALDDATLASIAALVGTLALAAVASVATWRALARRTRSSDAGADLSASPPAPRSEHPTRGLAGAGVGSARIKRAA